MQVELLKNQLRSTQEHLAQTQERLAQGIDENEGLFARLRQVESRGGGAAAAAAAAAGGRSSCTLRRSRSSTGSMPIPLHLAAGSGGGGGGTMALSKKSLPRLDSLSDLSNIDYHLDLDAIDRDDLVDEYLELRTRFEKVTLPLN